MDEVEEDGSSVSSESVLCGEELEDADEADDAEDGCDCCGDEVRDSESAELGEDDVDMFEQSEPRRPPRSYRALLLPSAGAPSSRFTIAATAAVGEGSGTDSSCCRKDSISANGSGDSGSVDTSGRKGNGGWDGMAVGVAGESDRNHGGE